MDKIYIAFHGLGIIYMIYLGSTTRVQNIGQATFFKFLPMAVSLIMINELFLDLQKYIP